MRNGLGKGAAVLLCAMLLAAGCGQSGTPGDVQGAAGKEGGAAGEAVGSAADNGSGGASSGADKAGNNASGGGMNGSSGSPAAGTRAVTDELGHKLEVPVKPAKVLAPYQEDALVLLGVKPIAQWSAGGTVQLYLQDKLKDVPLIDMTTAMSPEAVLALQPDMIILQSADLAANQMYEKYAKIAPTYVFENALGNTLETFRKLGELLGRTEEATKAIGEFETRIRETKQKLAAKLGSKKVALVQINSKKFRLIGETFFSGTLLYGDLGLGQPEAVKGKDLADLSLEMLPGLDADYLFIIDQNGGEGQTKDIFDSAVWKAMPAVKQGNVFTVEPAHWLGNGLIANGKTIDDIVKALAL